MVSIYFQNTSAEIKNLNLTLNSFPMLHRRSLIRIIYCKVYGIISKRKIDLIQTKVESKFFVENFF